MGMKSNAVELFTSRFFYREAMTIFFSAKSAEKNVYPVKPNFTCLTGVCVSLCGSVANF